MEEKSRKRVKFPILLKTAIIIFVFSLVVVEIAMTYYSLVMSNRNQETYNNYANSLSSTISKVVDVDDFNYMQNKVYSILDSIPKDELATFDQSEEKIDHYMSYYDSIWDDVDFVNKYNSTREVLRNIVDSYIKINVDCAYVSFVYKYQDTQGADQGLCCYLVDSAPDEDACPPGWIDPLYGINRAVLDIPERGFPAYTTNTSYGYLVSAGTFIVGSTRGYAFVDINMNAVRADQASSIVRLFAYLIITVVAIAIIGVILVYFIFSRPLRTITDVAKSFNNKDPKMSHRNFTDLNIKTRDELYELAEAIKTMENGVVQRINELVEISEALNDSEKQTRKMTALANKDVLTGVLSKIAYHSEVDRINEKIASKEDIAFGVAMIDLNYLKIINDEYGHSAGDEALIRLAGIVSLIFKRSPVYRFGGDEFVAILKDEDYKLSKELIEEFNERIEDSINNKKLPQYERISAAIGYAEYDPSVDTCMDDVFKRADQKMYERKREMKEEN